MGSISTGKTIEKLCTLFAAYGLPEELVCDNGTSFTSQFREFLRKNGVKPTISPPYHPASNGAAKRSVQEVKKDESRKKQEMRKRASDRLRGACRFFNENQKVLVKTVRQEKVSWVSGRILQCKSPVTYLVSVLGKTRVCHADHLRPIEVEEDENHPGK
ncbi:uncharacterized protein LOC128989175 [Macrosteles quadrilineatus]|uniref:uncharacterized protein LOC128989175 n=1 Tax=Macrosteles quadrilineatus TaxID=74068 RepID=UPI0023E2B513|nr:uncharacterized protein LOC128989175 [Macrosteles quadrilineatus]